jgi:uncharacterized LabA/DUF88 family protein
MTNKPVYAFIDSQNLNLAIKSLGWELDFRKFRVYLKDKYRVEKAYLFIGNVPGNEQLYKSLQEFGYILIFKPTLLVKSKGIIKGNCDAELVLHCMLEYKNYSKAIIISGDGDFYCLVEYLEKKGKLLKIGIPNQDRYSALLRKYNEYMFYINKLKNKLEHKKRGASAKRRNI